MERKRVVVTILDDLDQARDVDTPAEETHMVGLDGVVVTVDLTSAHGKALTEFLAPYMAAGRKELGGMSYRRAGHFAVGTALTEKRAENALIRAYGRAHKELQTEAFDRGYIPSGLRQAYYASLQEASE
jgi:hypothetical protein